METGLGKTGGTEIMHCLSSYQTSWTQLGCRVKANLHLEAAKYLFCQKIEFMSWVGGPSMWTRTHLVYTVKSVCSQAAQIMWFRPHWWRWYWVFIGSVFIIFLHCIWYIIFCIAVCVLWPWWLYLFFQWLQQGELAQDKFPTCWDNNPTWTTLKYFTLSVIQASTEHEMKTVY